MAMKLTPGPWEYKTTPGSDHEYCTVYAVGGQAIARHVLPDNAATIAALPDLLEACHVALHAFRQRPDREKTSWENEAWPKLQAAIAKTDSPPLA